MTQEQMEQYRELQELAKREERAEQAKIRRDAKKWIQEHYGVSLEMLDKIVANYKKRATEQRQAKGVQGATPPPPKANEVSGTFAESIKCNTLERR